MTSTTILAKYSGHNIAKVDISSEFTLSGLESIYAHGMNESLL